MALNPAIRSVAAPIIATADCTDGSKLEQDMGPGNEIDACGDHGRGVDQGADRCRAGHGIGQPYLEGKLGGFSESAAEQKGCCEDRGFRTNRPLLRGEGHQLLNIQRAEVREQEEKAKGHGGIADARHDEGFARSAAVCRVCIPEPDQEVAAKTDTFPSEVQEQQVVGKNEDKHRTNEEVHICEEAAVALVVGHVFR